jgi:hypothetical protein
MGDGVLGNSKKSLSRRTHYRITDCLAGLIVDTLNKTDVIKGAQYTVNIDTLFPYNTDWAYTEALGVNHGNVLML